MAQDRTDDKSTLAWCRQATSHHLNQCRLSPMTPYGVTGTQWVHVGFYGHIIFNIDYNTITMNWVKLTPPTLKCLVSYQLQLHCRITHITCWGQNEMTDIFSTIFTNSILDPLLLPCERNSGAMMPSSNGNSFRVTGHLWGEFTGPR